MSNESKWEYPDEDILAQFKSNEEFEKWANSLIEVKAEGAWDFDPDRENSKSITTSIQFDMTEGTSQSLDEFISKKAIIFADQLKQAAAFASKEEEIRIKVEQEL